MTQVKPQEMTPVVCRHTQSSLAVYFPDVGERSGDSKGLTHGEYVTLIVIRINHAHVGHFHENQQFVVVCC